MKDYTEPAVIEELAANSYDADAHTVVVLLDVSGQQLHLIDDGRGFTRDAIQQVAVLGGGNKRDVDFSTSERPYLGAYGFGLKSTVNIASAVRIMSVSEQGQFSVTLDWSNLEDALSAGFDGFDLDEHPRGRGSGTGTHIIMSLRHPTSESLVGQYLDVLGNLPDDKRRFRAYVGTYGKVKSSIAPALANFTKLTSVARTLASKKQLLLSDPSNNADLDSCTKIELVDKIDKDVTATIYFTGIRDGKVLPLKQGLRGIYVRIHGRLLKQSFTEQRYVYPISKWVKFASGIRVELTVDWLRNEISLARDGLKFSSPKLEEQFKSTLVRLVSAFIQPELKKLDAKSSKQTARKHAQRLELAKKRAQKTNNGAIAGLDNGFNYVPETDGELALLLAHPAVLKKVNPAWILLDYNDQAPFDCIIYDSKRRENVFAELEPTLIEFLRHNRFPYDLQMVIVWTLGKWRMGARKKGLRATYELITEKGAKPGEYKLLSYRRENSRKAVSELRVVALEELLMKRRRKDRRTSHIIHFSRPHMSAGVRNHGARVTQPHHPSPGRNDRSF